MLLSRLTQEVSWFPFLHLFHNTTSGHKCQPINSVIALKESQSTDATRQNHPLISSFFDSLSVSWSKQHCSLYAGGLAGWDL